MRDFALTTLDNPFNPFTQWNEWLAFDIKAGHFTCERLDKASFTSMELPDDMNDEELERAANEIVANDPLLIYVKIFRDNAEEFLEKRKNMDMGSLWNIGGVT